MSAAPGKLASHTTEFRLTDVEREKLWRVFGPLSRDLASFATAMLRFLSVADGKDVVQETFMLFARRAIQGGLRCLGNQRIADVDDSELDRRIPYCRAYLICVVVHKCCWFHRKERSHPLVFHEWAKQNIQGREPDPMEELSRQEVVDGVRRAVVRLPEHLQKVLTLHYYGRCSHEEIAIVLDNPEKARQWFDRIIEQLEREGLDEPLDNADVGREPT
jgi:DNA-directed RNA polymerase specialized sigma24 family protein